MTINPVRLNHAVLFVSDLARAERFYPTSSAWWSSPASHAPTLRSFGCRDRVTTTTSACSASARSRPSDAAASASTTSPGRSTPSTNEDAREVLRASDAYTGESSHGATKSIYGADPDGNEFEIVWMLPREEWGEYENAAPIDRLDLGRGAAALERDRHSGARPARLGRRAGNTV